MRIFLMRHGEAQLPCAGMADSQRPLSAAGRKQVGTLAHILATVLARRPLTLWSGSYERAVETAEIIRSRVEVTSFGIHYGAGTGEARGLLPEIVQTATTEDVGIVGHTPFVEQWLYDWTGVRISFSSPALAVIQVPIPYENRPSAQLLLYVDKGGLDILSYKERKM